MASMERRQGDRGVVLSRVRPVHRQRGEQGETESYPGLDGGLLPVVTLVFRGRSAPAPCPACPLAAEGLRETCPDAPAARFRAGSRYLRLTYWGFDHRAHTGSLVVRKTAVDDLRRVFARLYAARFPIRRIEPIDRFRASDNASMAADNTSAFNCRYAIAPGPRRWSAHAYGDAIDVNPVENPYVLGGRARPPAGAAYVDRAKVRRGMAVRGGVLVRAFAAVGWQWGGRWYGSPDYQHFSATGG